MLGLALAVLGRPELLFLDEPTTGMDPASRRRTWEVVRELRRAGTTVLLPTHYLEEAEALADRVAIMHAGRIVTSGAPDQVVRALPARISFRNADGADLSFLGSVVDALPALGVLAGWLLLVSLVASHVFRWKPRHR